MKYLNRSFPFRWYHAQTDTAQVLLLCTLFSFSLQLARIIYTGHLMFAFMVWNLFLAFIPYFISGWISRRYTNSSRQQLFLPVLSWVVFLPNSFYLLTDFFHLDMNRSVPLWFDLALLLSFAWTGLLLGMLSVRQMERLLVPLLGRWSRLFLLPVMFLNGLGVYVGRYLRFNSWDVISRPFQLAQDIFDLLIHPLRNRVDWSMIACYTLLLTLMYITMKKTCKEW